MLRIKPLLLCALLTIPALLFAQQKNSIYVCQFVRNSFTGYGVRGALVTVMDTTGRVIDTLRTEPGNGSHDAQLWGMSVPRQRMKLRVRVEHPDYETAETTVELKTLARLSSYRFPDLLLKRREKEIKLKGATVKATRVKLCYKGDTIEVDARAFKLTEGSMLESLVRNVPGCELRPSGEIYMNGRKVDYLTLNGKDFFKGNNRVMLDNLPYYTVDKLQFYNQRSERSQLLGRDVDRPDYVMNVKLKQEYSIGYMGNVEAAAGTHDRWLGRGFGLRFTDNSRLSLYGNANNVNEKRRPGDDGSWGQQASPVGDIKAYAVGGELLVDDKRGRYKEVLDASLDWKRARDEQRTASQQFLQQGDIYGYSRAMQKQRNFSVSADNHLTLKRIGLVSQTRFEYSDHDDDALTRSAQFAMKPGGSVASVIDSIFRSSLSSELGSIMVNNVQDSASSDGHKWKASQKFDYHKSLPWGDDLSLTARCEWSGAKDDADSRYLLRYSRGEASDDRRDRLTRALQHAYDLQLGASYALHFLSGWHLNFGAAHQQRGSHERSDLYRLDWREQLVSGELLPSMASYLSLRDAANSPHSRTMRREEQLTTALHRHDYDGKRGRYFQFSAGFGASYVNQEAAITRGESHARPSDNRWLLRPSLDLEYETRQWHDAYALHYDTEMRSPSLLQMADMSDTSNPLLTEMGNPRLRPTITHNLSLRFNSRFGTHGQFAMLRTSASVMQRLVAMNSIYNSATGAYTLIPVNINGNWSSRSSLELRRALSADRKLNVESTTSYSFIRSVDMKDGARSVVRQHIAGEDAKLEYKHSLFTLALLGSLTWNGVRLAGISDINSVDFSYGANAQVNLPLGMHISTDIRMYSRRGYTDRSMCTDDLLWNAQIDRSFLRGRLLAAVKAFDLLHQISSTRITINSQARVETWQLSLPSYVMLSLQLKLNKNPEKKK